MSKNFEDWQTSLIQLQTPKIQYVGLGLMDALTVLFVWMKLADVGAVAFWSWWWVLSPQYLPYVGRVLIEYLVRVVTKMRQKTVNDV